MATYKSSLCAANPMLIRQELGLNCVVAEYCHTSGAQLQESDVIQMVPVPKNATVVDVQLYVPAGFNTLAGSTAGRMTGALVVGDGVSGSRYINKADNGTTLYSGGVVSTAIARKTRKGPFSYTSAGDTVDITLASGPTAWSSSSKYLRLTVWYIVNYESQTASTDFSK